MISIIIPTLNESQCIENTLEHLTQWQSCCEIIVVDGNSTDTTIDICRNYSHIQLIELPAAQRARQMNRGAAVAKGDILLFLHADTIPPSNFLELIHDSLSNPEVIGGAFSLKFDCDHWLLTVIERVSHFNIPWLTFGDHGMFVRKADFRRLNGFAEIPIMEDLELQMRMNKNGILARPNASVHTSARRFIKNGVIRQTILDFWILLAYFSGVGPAKLARYYPKTGMKAR